MKIKHKRILALLLLAAMMIGIAPSVLAAGDSAASSAESAVESSGESAGTQEASSAETDEPRIAPPEATALTPVEEDTGDDDVPRSEDGETLTRDEDLLAPSLLGISLFAANSTGTVSKSTCVNFAQYQSPTWYCNRYYTEGSHDTAITSVSAAGSFPSTSPASAPSPGQPTPAARPRSVTSTSAPTSWRRRTPAAPTSSLPPKRSPSLQAPRLERPTLPQRLWTTHGSTGMLRSPRWTKRLERPALRWRERNTPCTRTGLR